MHVHVYMHRLIMNLCIISVGSRIFKMKGVEFTNGKVFKVVYFCCFTFQKCWLLFFIERAPPAPPIPATL